MNKLLLQIVPLLWSAMSPVIKDTIKEALDSLEQRAASTDNPWDDLGVQILKELINL